MAKEFASIAEALVATELSTPYPSPTVLTEYPSHPFRIRPDPDARQDLFVNPSEKARLVPLIQSYAAFDPEEADASTNTTGFSPRLAYDLRKLFGGNASDDTPINECTSLPGYKDNFTNQQKSKLNPLFNALDRQGLTTVGSVRNASLITLLDLRSVGEQGAVFLKFALRKFDGRRRG